MERDGASTWADDEERFAEGGPPGAEADVRAEGSHHHGVSADHEDGGGQDDVAAPVVAGWTPVRRLGAGTQAEAWLVRDADGAEAVLKVAAPGEDPAPLVDEAAAYGRLRHDHLLRVLGTVETDRGPGVLGERLPAGSLAGMVRQAGPLSPGQAVTLLVPIAQALAHLHANGVVHGDVSPGNVLFALDGRPALVDLGVARVVGGASGVGGTPGFIAPERRAELDGTPAAPCAGGTVDAAAADVYAWAALGWYAMTGRAPGPREHRAPLPVLVSDVPVELALLLDAALDPDPAARPTAEEAAAAAYSSARPEPVPLHEAAPTEVAHLLPTLVPSSTPTPDPVGRRRRSGAARARPALGGATAARAPRRRPRTPLLVVGAVVLAGGLAAGALRAQPETGLPTDVAASSTGRADSAARTGSAPSAPATGGTSSSAAAAPTAAPSEDRVETGTAAAGDALTAPALAEDPSALARMLDEVAQARVAALTDPTADRLEDYTAPGGGARTADGQVQEELLAGGWAFSGLAMEILPDGPVRAEDETTLRVPVVMTTGEHTVLDETGAVVQDVAPRSEDASLVLRRGDDGRWRVLEVERR